MSVLTAICAVLMTVNVSVFAWSVVGVFRAHADVSRMLLVLKAGAVVSAVAEVWAIVASDTDGAPAVVGIALLVGALALFFAATRASRREFTLAFSRDQPRFLVESGPYRYVRHPFYTSYLVTYLAGLIATGNAWLTIVVVGMGAIYVVAARREEAKFMQSELADAYARYRARTGMFLPSPFHRRAAPAA